MDCEASPFGMLLCRRLGYMQVEAAPWSGNETSGLQREVTLSVKLPPKPMLPDCTRVHLRHRLVRGAGGLRFEREVGMLDVPYGEAFRLQECWLAQVTSDGMLEPSGRPTLQVLAHVHFRSRPGLLGSKIKAHSLKRSRKVATLALELLSLAQQGTAPANQGQVEASGRDMELQERYDALLQEATYLRRHAQQLERENRRIQANAKYVRKSKKQLLETIAALEATIARERRERALMEEELTEAYNSTLRQLVEGMEASAGGRGCHGSVTPPGGALLSGAATMRNLLPRGQAGYGAMHRRAGSK